MADRQHRQVVSILFIRFMLQRYENIWIIQCNSEKITLSLQANFRKMIQPLQSLSRWLAQHASLFVTAIAVLTFFVPDLFLWVRGTTQTVILGIIMLTMGLTLTTQDFRILAKRPLDILIGACAQFFIMPCVAYLLVHVFRLEPALALGILLVGCCPGGVSSNIMSYLCHGDVAFSVGHLTKTSNNQITIISPSSDPRPVRIIWLIIA